MTALTVFLHTKGVVASPRAMNQWLRDHDGYVDVGGDLDNLNLPVVHQLDRRIQLVGFLGPSNFTLDSVIQWMLDGWCPILHVENGRHFVLPVGYFLGPEKKPNGTLVVRDSFFPRATRDFSEVSHVLLYSWR